jgi:hypothetical protein
MLENKCHYCNNEGTITARVVVDADVVHDGDDWAVTALKSDVLVCENCAEAIEEGVDLNEGN